MRKMPILSQRELLVAGRCDERGAVRCKGDVGVLVTIIRDYSGERKNYLYYTTIKRIFRSMLADLITLVY